MLLTLSWLCLGKEKRRGRCTQETENVKSDSIQAIILTQIVFIEYCSYAQWNMKFHEYPPNSNKSLMISSRDVKF